MIFLTSPGKTYSVNSISGCTVSAGGTTLATIPANVQTTFIAPDDAVTVSDNNAIIVEVTGVGAGGSGGSGEGGSGGVTAEEIQAVAPIAWGAYDTPPTSLQYGVALGDGANAAIDGLALGKVAKSAPSSIAIGQGSYAQTSYALAVGRNTYAIGHGTVALGFADRGSYNMATKSSLGITIGSQFVDKVNGVDTNNMCTTEGTGSITIGAGANTLGETSTNSVTIGCKAENKGADSIVIGASAKVSGVSGISIGANSSSGVGSVCIGNKSAASGGETIAMGHNSYAGLYSVAVGSYAKANGNGAIAMGQNAFAASGGMGIGHGSKANAAKSIAIGMFASVSDYGATVIRSTSEDGTVTQLYFSGANTPLANTYANGEGIMGYVTSDKDGNPIASGFKRLSALFDEGTMTQPATLDENGELVQPKVFRPSDIDLPVEEPTEPEPYTPLPVYPIVEPEIEELPSES